MIYFHSKCLTLLGGGGPRLSHQTIQNDSFLSVLKSTQIVYLPPCSSTFSRYQGWKDPTQHSRTQKGSPVTVVSRTEAPVLRSGDAKKTCIDSQTKKPWHQNHQLPLCPTHMPKTWSVSQSWKVRSCASCLTDPSSEGGQVPLRLFKYTLETKVGSRLRRPTVCSSLPSNVMSFRSPCQSRYKLWQTQIIIPWLGKE